MSDFKISELGTRSAPGTTDDLIINDNTDSASPETKRTSVASLAAAIGAIIGSGGGTGVNSFFDPIYFYDTSVKTASVPSGSGGIRGWHSMTKANIPMPAGANAAVMIHYMGSNFQPTATGSGSYRLYGDLETKLTGGSFLAGSQSAPSTIMGRVITHNVPTPGGTANLSRKSSTPNTKIDIITFDEEAALTFDISFNITNQAPCTLSVGLGRIILIPFFAANTAPISALLEDGSGFYASDDDDYAALVQQYLPPDTDVDLAEDDGAYIRAEITQVLALIEAYLSTDAPVYFDQVSAERVKLLNMLNGVTPTTSVEGTRTLVKSIRNTVLGYTAVRFGFETAAGSIPF